MAATKAVEQLVDADPADASGIMGVPVGTVKSRLHRGRKMLYQALLPVATDLRMVV